MSEAIVKMCLLIQDPNPFRITPIVILKQAAWAVEIHFQPSSHSYPGQESRVLFKDKEYT